MSASAGRVLLMPKGEWSSTVQYTNLDWVRYNKASWVCKKSCIGVKPSETSTENWQLIVQDPEEMLEMVGATESQNGTHGLVPAPQIGDEKKALLGDGTWGTVDAVYSFATEEAFNQAVTNDEIPDGSKVIKEWDEEIVDINIDSAMSVTSTNPVQNKVIKAYVDERMSTINEATTASNGLMSAADKAKLDAIASNAEVNAQSDWSVTDTSSDAFILNKPTLATVATSGSYNDLSDKPTIPSAVTVDDSISATSTNAIQNKIVFNGDYGVLAKTTTFNGDNITEVDGNGYTRTTTFNSDGSITEQIADSSAKVVATKTTVFNSDGSITESVS